jgi:tRNA pseudouridine55 synthase
MITTAESSDLDGFAIINKPIGLTSFSLLGKLSGKLNKKVKIGHAGTLDSFASGVLVCLFGRYTRLSDYFMSSRKSYDALISFGTETDTLDPEGKITGYGIIPSIQMLLAVLPGFMGEIQQVPPRYSAIHLNGQRAYERVRKGQEFTLSPRAVTIYDLQLKSFEHGKALISVDCSKGTYIRSLARDIAVACGSRGHLVALLRTASVPFTCVEAVGLDEFDQTVIRKMYPAISTGLGIGNAFLDENDAACFIKGIPLNRIHGILSLKERRTFAVYDQAERLLGIVTPTPSASAGFHYAFVLARPN